MAVVVVVGAQWGDEGKGKVVDHFAEHADLVVRYGGGANAGHTLVRGDTKIVTHLLPSGVMHPGTLCVLGDGMVVDPDALLEEIDGCRELGFLDDEQLLISGGAHVIMPYYRIIEELREEGARPIGTTRRGIGPAYEAKVARRGIQVRDLLDGNRLRELVEHNLAEVRALIEYYGGSPPTREALQSMIDSALAAGERLAPWIGDGGPVVDAAIKGGKNVLLEGAQGALLDLDHGTYPYVTSSTTTAAGACHGVGIGPTRIDTVVGITKAYCTRVGEGPFPSEMSTDEAEEWRQAGGEFGATTGRPRRCGWLDVAALRRAVRINGIESLAVTKLDILGGRGPIRVCVGYRDGEQRYDELPGDTRRVARLEPVFETLPGWSPVPEARSLGDLPVSARDFLDRIADWTGTRIGIVSVGPDRADTVVLDNPFAA